MKILLCLATLLFIGCRPVMDCTGQEKLLIEQATVCAERRQYTYADCLNIVKFVFCKEVK